MATEKATHLKFGPGPKDRTVRDASGDVRAVPAGWDWLPAGDAGVTRRVKAAGETWGVAVKRGRRTFNQGLWAPKANVDAAVEGIAAMRADPGYARKQAAAKGRRERAHGEYVLEFTRHVRAFLGFAPAWVDLERAMARAVAEHATPVGSGTVARTQRIPVNERAQAAVIAWMRHQTTVYDRMQIARVRGERREVRRALARQSRQLLDRYRDGEAVAPTCPLQTALKASPGGASKVRTSPATKKTAASPATREAIGASSPAASAPEPPESTPSSGDAVADARALRQAAVRARRARRGRG